MSEVSLLQKQLWDAVSRSQNDQVFEMISKGACVDTDSEMARMALYQCISEENIDILAALIKAGIPLEGEDHTGRTLLHDAAEEGSLPMVVSLLLNAGANIHAVTKDGDTALHLAMYNEYAYENRRLVVELLERGADVNAMNSNGKTAMDVLWPYREIHQELHFSLISYGAKVNKASNPRGARLNKLTMRQAAAFGGLTTRMLELLEERTSDEPGDEPSLLADIAKKTNRAETAAAIQAVMAGQAIESMINTHAKGKFL